MTNPETLELPADVAEAHAQTLQNLRDRGETVGSEKPTQEILGYQTGMSNPRARLSSNMGSTVGAVARFVWLIAGSDRLEDIAFYESRVRTYSDDGISVPGSSYGRRLFSASPGLNQIAGVVAELKENPESRRAAAVVWLPEDAVRKSNDIPCTFGLFFHIRDGQLTVTTVMRSNNAVTLLPYNFFEFSMVGEMVAASVGVPIGRYVHWAASMHFFESMRNRAESIADGDRVSYEMPPMPEDDPLDYGRRLAILESRLRHAVSHQELLAVADDATTELIPYWLDLFNVLFAYSLAKRGLRIEAEDALDALPGYLNAGTKKTITGVLDETDPLPTDDGLFGVNELELADYNQRAGLVADASLNDTAADVLGLAGLLKQAAPAGGADVTLDEFLAVRETLLTRKDVTLAARPASGLTGGPTVAIVTLDDVRDALNDVRNR